MNIIRLLQDAWSLRRERNYNKARELIEIAHMNCDKTDHALMGRIYHIYMQFERDHEKYEEALEWSWKSLKHYEETDNPLLIAHSVRHLADLHRLLGQLDESEELYTKAINSYKSQMKSGHLDLANALRGYALLLEKLNKKEEAIKMWNQARQIYQSNGIQAGVEESNDKLEYLKTC